MDWIWQNRAWLFDGIGATIVGGLIVRAIIRFLSASREQPRGSAVEVRADHGASLTGSPIANGSNITQTINIGAVSVPTTSPALDYRSDPTPQDILRQIRSAPPFDQARITKNYQGLPVRWPLWLGSISEAEASSNIHGLTLLPAGDANSQIILCDVDVSQYPHLKIANGGDPLEVTGIVGEVSLSGYAIRLKDVRLVFQGPRPPLQFLKNPEGKAGTVSYPITEESPNEISEIRFDYLPASLLDNGWVPANSNVGASGNGSIPLDCPGGLTRVAGSSDAVDFRLEKYQRACNGLRFRAKLCDGAHVYAKVQLVPSDGRNVPKSGWIACDIGDKSPEQRPHEEWVIFRKPQKYGWALFDLYLPDEIKRTFGHREGFELGELLGIRLRGSLSVSPIKLYLEEEVKPSDSQP